MFFLRSALLLSLVGLLRCCIAQDSKTLEIDLIYPRNETYAPTDLLPVVFGLRGSFDYDLALRIEWNAHYLGIIPDPTPNGTRINGILEPYMNFLTESNSVFAIDSILNPTALEGSYQFFYHILTTNCTGISAAVSNASIVDFAEYEKNITFTIQKGAPLPNIQSLMNQTTNTCAANNETFIFES